VVFSFGALLMGWDFLAKLMQPRGTTAEPRAPAATVAAE
jgi:hypothetical protein